MGHEDLVELSAAIVAEYVSNNTVAIADIPKLMTTIYDALSSLGKPKLEVAEHKEPAVPIKKSVTPDYIVCLEDGKKMKMLKRHIKTEYGMTPDQYRAKWGLPPDYPMVAPNYAAQRSEFAKKICLGTSRKRLAKAA